MTVFEANGRWMDRHSAVLWDDIAFFPWRRVKPPRKYRPGRRWRGYR